MAQHPIVPDPGESHSTVRYRRSPRPRLWPLWSIVLLLILAAGTGGWYAWQTQQKMSQEITRLTKDLSNMHARFDSERDQGDILELFQQQLDKLAIQEKELQSSLDRLSGQWQDDIAEKSRALEERLNQFEGSSGNHAKRFESLVQRIETQEQTLEATGRSLSAVERAGDEGRGALEARLARLDDSRENQDKRVATLSERVDSDMNNLEQKLDETLGSLNIRLDNIEQQQQELVADIEAVSQSGEDDRSKQESLSARLAELELDMTELRQTQLSLSAQLEALR
ncbi:hypothetical protein [Halomonas binhaiensis]|uniref:Uncharacterized protein n=1 Tax=Halomonas binhaiensis TaxID=2562282 RepID=A0A5C1NG57_9GAMM|nr:hypothetical protein [Halomonas binhaiensis]QEM81851.1 hypothetical protein E4T21_10000 [Halomonas binhaiensis]